MKSLISSYLGSGIFGNGSAALRMTAIMSHTVGELSKHRHPIKVGLQRVDLEEGRQRARH